MLDRPTQVRFLLLRVDPVDLVDLCTACPICHVISFCVLLIHFFCFLLYPLFSRLPHQLFLFYFFFFFLFSFLHLLVLRLPRHFVSLCYVFGPRTLLCLPSIVLFIFLHRHAICLAFYLPQRLTLSEHQPPAQQIAHLLEPAPVNRLASSHRNVCVRVVQVVDVQEHHLGSLHANHH